MCGINEIFMQILFEMLIASYDVLWICYLSSLMIRFNVVKMV